jgi:hypothetical protein
MQVQELTRDRSPEEEKRNLKNGFFFSNRFLETVNKNGCGSAVQGYKEAKLRGEKFSVRGGKKGLEQLRQGEKVNQLHQLWVTID